MNNSPYVIRRKIYRIKPTPIPKTTYAPETFVQKSVPSLKAPNATIEKLAQPNRLPSTPSELPPIPKYQNPPPNFASVDFRVNVACLQRDLYIMNQRKEKERSDKANEPSQFFDWQEKMKQKDQDERDAIVLERHQALDNSRKGAIKAKKKIIEERFELGNQLRINLSKDIQEAQNEIEQERLKIKELKRQLVDGAPNSISRSKRQKQLETKEMKRQLRDDLKAAQKVRAKEIEDIKKNAQKVREDSENHVLSHGNQYQSKIEITETRFLSAVTDEEATELIRQHAETKRKQIENEIQNHRRMKEEKMEKLMQMLEEATKARDEREEEHIKQRREKIEAAQKELQEKEEEEDRRMLLLEKKLEKKRQEKINEAKEMEEHTRQIAARNRYMALNKKALAANVFTSQQDAKLRSAKERQTLNLKDQTKSTNLSPTRKSSAELVNLKGLLGI